MTYEAIGKNIIIRVKKKPEEEGTRKAVIIVNTAKPWDHIDYSEVLSIGDEVSSDIVIEKGDTILTRSHSGMPIAPAEDDKTIRVIDQSEILAKLS